MSKMIQIRNVPDEVHQELKVRATKAGMSLSQYLLREITNSRASPRLRTFSNVSGSESRSTWTRTRR